MLIFCVVFGAVYHIPTTEVYSASTKGTTATEILSNFNSINTEIDTKSALNASISQANKYIATQQDSCDEKTALENINNKFQNGVTVGWDTINILNEIKAYKQMETCYFLNNNSVSPITETANELKNYIEDYKKIENLETRLILTESQMTKLENFSNFLLETTKDVGSDTTKIKSALNAIYDNSAYFDELNSITKNAYVSQIDEKKVSNIQKTYIAKANEKIEKISQEMSTLKSEDVDQMKNLITAYKITCESAKRGVYNELLLLLDEETNLSKAYGYKAPNKEQLNLEIAYAKYYVDASKEIGYVAHQSALNFNTATGKETAYDKAYMLMAIVGVLTILFGIGSAYKFFGLDRRNGKVDILLAQKATSNQVFVGKCLAIFLTTSAILIFYGAVNLLTGFIVHGTSSTDILTVFNNSIVYTIHPFTFYLIKIVGIELQVIFFSMVTITLMNITRKFELAYIIALLIYVATIVLNIFLNNQIWYCLLPFVHIDLTSFIGGATMNTGFLVTSLYSYGNFFISAIYYLVIVGLLFAFTRRLFKKN